MKAPKKVEIPDNLSEMSNYAKILLIEKINERLIYLDNKIQTTEHHDKYYDEYLCLKKEGVKIFKSL